MIERGQATNKPIKQTTVEELRPDALCDVECEGRCRICGVDAWAEITRRLEESQKRNKLLVEALEEISRRVWIYEGTTTMDCAKVADEALKQSAGEP